MSFKSIMVKIGEDIKVGFEDVVKYLPAAAGLASLIFPAEGVAIAAGETSIDLIQKAVVTVEQKFAATGTVTGTGIQKLAQVTSIVAPTVIQLLSTEKVPIDSTRVTAIVNAVVAVLNATDSPAVKTP
jgi:hypothetical protein